MQKVICLILIIVAAALGYFGFKNLNEKKAEVKIGDVKITAKESDTKTKGYAFLGGAAICLIAGVVMVSRKSGSA